MGIDPIKSKFSLKSKKKSDFFFVCFLDPFCYKNVEKMFYQPQKVTFLPQKVKKVKKIFFLFFTYWVRKSHIYTYIFGFCPLTPSINKTYEKNGGGGTQIFQIFSNTPHFCVSCARLFSISKAAQIELPYIFYTRIDPGIGPRQVVPEAGSNSCNG